ncbi:MAG: M56 family metallopeptidase [Chloroflexia bacterium]|nr:M56 family metallopeptidase [Chloroflexia bacterium]
MTSVGRGALREVMLPAAAALGALMVGALALGRLAGGIGHVGELALGCLLAPLAALDAAAHLGTLATTGLAGFAATAMAAAVVRQWVQARAVSQAVDRARLSSLPPSVAAAAVAVGVPERVDLVDARRPFAFVYGWRHPRICVSTGLVDRFSAGELQAALLHERWHVMRRDPMRLTLASAVRAGLCFLPPFRTRAEQYVVAVEIAADRFVVTQMGDARWLAGALLRLQPGTVSPGLGGQLEPRIAALVDGTSERERGRIGWGATVLAMETAAAALLIPDSRLTAPLGYVLLHVC